jgi:D-hexose-6-phosphate mutarotase
MKVGNKIKSFTVMNIVEGIAFNYTDSGKKIKYNTQYMLLLSDNGQERVLEIGKTNLNDCVKWHPTFSDKSKFISWNQL